MLYIYIHTHIDKVHLHKYQLAGIETNRYVNQRTTLSLARSLCALSQYASITVQRALCKFCELPSLTNCA